MCSCFNCYFIHDYPVLFLKGHLQTVGDLGEMSQFHPAIRWPNVPINLETLWIILPSSVALAMVGLIESLLTIPIVDKMTASQSDSQRGS